MKLYAIVAGFILGVAALAIHPTVKAHSNIPIPLCPPDQPNCSLNQ